jgi:hypothetical protein
MTSVRVVVVLALGCLMSACVHDEHWEGTMDRCSGNSPNTAVIMLLSPPVTEANGFFGYSVNSANDTWEMGEFKNGTAGGGTLKFEAVFTSGGNTERWQVDLKRAPLAKEYTGTVDRLAGNTVRCDVTLSKAK